MLGPEGVIDLITARLADALPGKLAQLRARYGIGVSLLPDPIVLACEPEDTPIELARFPVLFLVEQQTPKVGTPQKRDSGWDFRIVYQISVAYFVRDAGFAASAAQRRRLGLAVREVLLERPHLTANAEESVTLDVSGWVERYGATTRGAAGLIVGGELSAQFTAVEFLATPTAALGGVPHDVAAAVELLSGVPLS